MGAWLRWRDRARVPAGGARRSLLPRQAVAAGGAPGPQHVRADMGPFPAAQHVRGPVQDAQPHTAVRAAAGPANRPHLSVRRAR